MRPCLPLNTGSTERSLEKATSTYLGLFGLDAAMGLAERLLRVGAGAVPPPMRVEHGCGAVMGLLVLMLKPPSMALQFR